ncbi:LysR family transcriptional regulator [Photobacterium gaetbulicola]|uniref:Transcriptional regulator n=1 Tax=Photobacterium gaetbulicola Gung47 TaxID=658445 RepID=A0A0C5WZ33_9GAMM|nr:MULTISPECIES: LysR family transcriptional regulator [Photobacterium]AJR08260.1 transcriptional regulator [Photobacterium gaetbulicola Gung47]PSU09060.1 LysR family transcriptional regulator [Photobacterium gaetbulicola]WEM43454.1 LysR family transcriptional regulator [Photobacterium sp. DA100]
MKLSQLALFLDTCDTGSITEAAKRCGKNRTTVSSALSALEDELGVSLLQRTGNQVQLTEIGDAIRNDAERILMIANDIHAKCQQHLEGVESALRIARDDALPEAFWRQLVHDLSIKFPNSSLSIYVAPPPELDEMVEQNMVDMAFCLLPTDDNLPNNQYTQLGQIRMMSVARADHPLNQLSEVLSDDLAHATEFVLAAIKDQSLTAVSPTSSNYIALTFYEHLRNAVLDGNGWSTVPSVLINSYLRDGTLKVLNHYQSMRWQPYGVIYGKHIQLGSVSRWLSSQLEAYLDKESN